MDSEKIERGVRMILEGIGEDPNREGLVDTPTRVARMYEELFTGLGETPDPHFEVTFDAEHREMIVVRDIPVYSMCEHHLIPFFGVAHVAYIPGDSGRVCGISKLARVVDVFAKRPQLQERLTSQVVEAIVDHLDPSGALVVIDAEHLCMTMRGVRKPGARTTTSAVRGSFQRSPATRTEALDLIFQSGRR